MKTKLTTLMSNRDKLIFKVMRLAWYQFKKRADLNKRIAMYQTEIEQEFKKLAQN